MTKNDPQPIEEMSYEEAYAELEQIVARMEAGEDKLEAAMEAFLRGQALIKRCAALLDEAELKVRQLSGEPLAEAGTEE